MVTNLWIVLLDTSGSMRHGFTASSSATGLVERGRWQNKIEAATDRLCQRLSTLRSPDIAVVEFKSSPRLLFHCHASEFYKYEAGIRSIEAGGGTDLALAFNELFSLFYKGGYKKLTDYERIHVLVISDGLTNSHNAGKASQKFVNDIFPVRTNVKVLLVDQTPEGDETAYLVATDDDVTYAESYEATTDATGRAAGEVLSETLRKHNVYQRALFREYLEVQDKPSMATIGFVGSGEQTFNSKLLSKSIIPTIAALEKIQSVSEIEVSYSDVQILSISKSSDIKASVSGIAKAVEVVDERFTPWKREHARMIAQLQRDKLALELRKLEAETIQTEHKTTNSDFQNRIRELEFRRAKAETERLELENEERRIQIRERKIRQQLADIAYAIGKQFCKNVDSSHSDLLEQQNIILEALIDLTNSEHVIEVIRDEADFPTKGPERSL